MDLGTPELFMILMIVLLIFGPGRIVKLSRELGLGIRQLREGVQSPPEPDHKEETGA